MNQLTRHGIPFLIRIMVSIIAIGLNFVVMVGQVRFDSKAIPRQRLTMNLAGGGVVLCLKITLVVYCLYIYLQRLALTAAFKGYPANPLVLDLGYRKYDIVSELCVLDEKCGQIGGKSRYIRCDGISNPNPCTK